MMNKEKMKELLEASPDGIITAEQVTDAGVHRSVLKEFVDDGIFTVLDVVCMCAVIPGKMIFTCCSVSTNVESTLTILRCICWAILTALRQSTL